MKGNIYTDQNGQLPVQSSRGNTHVMVIYDHDSNDMLTKPSKHEAVVEHLKSIQEVHQCLNSRGTQPKIQIMDIEWSSLFKDCIKNEKKI